MALVAVAAVIFFIARPTGTDGKTEPVETSEAPAESAEPTPAPTPEPTVDPELPIDTDSANDAETVEPGTIAPATPAPSESGGENIDPVTGLPLEENELPIIP